MNDQAQHSKVPYELVKEYESEIRLICRLTPDRGHWALWRRVSEDECIDSWSAEDQILSPSLHLSTLIQVCCSMLAGLLDENHHWLQHEIMQEGKENWKHELKDLGEDEKGHEELEKKREEKNRPELQFRQEERSWRINQQHRQKQRRTRENQDIFITEETVWIKFPQFVLEKCNTGCVEKKGVNSSLLLICLCFDVHPWIAHQRSSWLSFHCCAQSRRTIDKTYYWTTWTWKWPHVFPSRQTQRFLFLSIVIGSAFQFWLLICFWLLSLIFRWYLDRLAFHTWLLLCSH